MLRRYRARRPPRLSCAPSRQLMQHGVERRHRSGVPEPRPVQLPELPRRQAEFAAERPDEGGVAAEAQFDRKVDQPLVLGAWRDQEPQGMIEPLLTDVMRQTAVGFKQPIEARARDLELAAQLARGERVGEVARDVALDHRKIKMPLRPFDALGGIRRTGGRRDDVGDRLDRALDAACLRLVAQGERREMAGEQARMGMLRGQQGCGCRIRMGEARRQHRALQDDGRQLGAAAAGAQHGAAWLRHVDQEDVAGAHRDLAPSGAEPHFAFTTEGDLIVIEAAAGDMCRGPVIFEVAHARLHQQHIAGHPRPRGEMEVLLGRERDQVADLGQLHPQCFHRVRSV